MTNGRGDVLLSTSLELSVALTPAERLIHSVSLISCSSVANSCFISRIRTWPCFAARFVEEVNDAAGRAAEKDDEKTHRANELGFFNRDTAEVVEHDLKDLFAQPDAGKTDRQRGDRAFDRHDGKKIDCRHGRRRKA